MSLLLALVTIVVYWPAVHCEFVGYDDPLYVTANSHVLTGLSLKNAGWAFTTGEAANWHPLTWLSLMLDVSLLGTKPAGFHFTNLMLHALDAALLFWLLQRLTGTLWRSAAVAALWAWHPVHVESVAWIPERKDVLSALFAFLSLLFYERRARSPGSRSRFFYGASLLAFALGLMSKPMLVTLPAVLLLLDYWPLGRFRPGRAWPLLREKIPFVLLAIAASVVTFFVQRQGGAVVPEDLLPLSARVGNALISYCRYLGKMACPTKLSLLYTHFGYWPAVQVALAVGFLAVLSALFWINRGRFPFLLVGWLWYLVTLVPVIGLVQVGEQAMADRYTYIPSVGILLITIWGLSALTCRWRYQTPAMFVLASLTILMCLTLTRRQIGYWQNDETLFGHALAVTENSYTVRTDFGNALLVRGQTAAALAQFNEALRLRPDYAPSYFNLGVALDKLGKTEAAIEGYRTALRLRPADSETHNNLSGVLVKRGETNAAINELREAVRLKPDFALAHENLARLFSETGQTDQAVNEYREALRWQPGNAFAHYNLGGIFLEQGQWDAARDEFEADLKLNPQDAEAHYNLGNLFTRKGQVSAAIPEFVAAIQLQPGDAIAHNNLGLLLAGIGQTNAALDEFREALRLTPNNAQIHCNLGDTLAAAGQADAAINQFNEALHLNPDFASARKKLAAILGNKKTEPMPTAPHP